MRKLAIVTLTRFPDLFERLALSVPPDFRGDRIVVTSGDAEITAPGWRPVPGREPFVFARNANRGILVTPSDSDVVLVNDDCTFEAGCLERLAAVKAPGFGLLAPQVRGYAANPAQDSRSFLPYEVNETRNWLAFVCVLIPRDTLIRVGTLDARFTGYGFEDSDYCTRVAAAGLRLGVVRDAVVTHGTAEMPCSTSFRRLMSHEEQIDSLGAMKQVFEEKYAAV